MLLVGTIVICCVCVVVDLNSGGEGWLPSSGSSTGRSNPNEFITTCKRSGGKVMFSRVCVSVCLFTGAGELYPPSGQMSTTPGDLIKG